ncbi:MAG: adenylyltransferase/cytidyltransferase family protein [Candidatus Saganbacteria bacterium]|nr:adenylyltransferase/cytidyltransferase family protein [Candidatus Saganbacteria bacterium]
MALKLQSNVDPSAKYAEHYGLWAGRYYAKQTKYLGGEIQPEKLILHLPKQNPAAHILRAALAALMRGEQRFEHESVTLALSGVIKNIWQQNGWFRKGRFTEYPNPRPRIGVFPGTFSPVHLGHLTAILGSLLFGELDAIVIMPGRDIPSKPFALSLETRTEMLASVANDLPGVFISTLRGDVSETLERMQVPDQYCYSKRRLADVVAYSLLFEANPHVDWVYFITGEDKVREYAPSMRDNRELVLETLVPHNTRVMFFARGEKTPIVPDTELTGSWFRKLADKGFFVLNDSFPSFELSSSRIRKAIAEKDTKELNQLLAPQAIGDVFAPHSSLRIKACKIADVFALEHGYLDLRTRGLERLAYEEGLREINQQRAFLFKRGLLQNGDPLTT